MRLMIVCLCLAVMSPLAACGTVDEASATTAAQPQASDAAMRASRAQAAAQSNAAVDRALRGG
ncbi:hypothetical protein [Brevundimonas sp.]|uniref:hypothetical protein n=1 Tax=Brevundimonas sp. TaxID=1871086 RepID=UPI002ED82266